MQFEFHFWHPQKFICKSFQVIENFAPCYNYYVCPWWTIRCGLIPCACFFCSSMTFIVLCRSGSTASCFIISLVAREYFLCEFYINECSFLQVTCTLVTYRDRDPASSRSQVLRLQTYNCDWICKKGPLRMHRFFFFVCSWACSSLCEPQRFFSFCSLVCQTTRSFLNIFQPNLCHHFSHACSIFILFSARSKHLRKAITLQTHSCHNLNPQQMICKLSVTQSTLMYHSVVSFKKLRA